MLWHRTAVEGDGEQAAAARQRLIAYNEDDVQATAEVRAWMRSTTFPALEDLDALFAPPPTGFSDGPAVPMPPGDSTLGCDHG